MARVESHKIQETKCGDLCGDITGYYTHVLLTQSTSSRNVLLGNPSGVERALSTCREVVSSAEYVGLRHQYVCNTRLYTPVEFPAENYVYID